MGKYNNSEFLGAIFVNKILFIFLIFEDNLLKTYRNTHSSHAPLGSYLASLNFSSFYMCILGFV
jgi:hypothetical protein